MKEYVVGHSFGGKVSRCPLRWIYFYFNRVSVESRRHSLDSTVSVQAVELTGVVRNTKRHMRHKKNRPRESSAQMHVSQESTLGAQVSFSWIFYLISFLLCFCLSFSCNDKRSLKYWSLSKSLI